MVVEVAFNFSVRAAIPSKNQGKFDSIHVIFQEYLHTKTVYHVIRILIHPRKVS